MSLFTFLRTRFKSMENQEARNQGGQEQPSNANTTNSTGNTQKTQPEQDIVKIKHDLQELFTNGGTPAEQQEMIQRIDDLSCQIETQAKSQAKK